MSDMGAERGRDAGIGGAGTDRKGAESSANRDDRQGREQAARSTATKSKQADLQSFGATPPGSQPSRQEAQDLGRAIDDLNSRQSGVGGFVNNMFGLRNEVAVNPSSGQWDVKSYKSFNPTENVIGMAANAFLGPLGGAAVSGVLSAIGFEDPLGFEIDLGFGDAKGNGRKSDPEKDRHDKVNLAAKTQSPAESVGQQSPGQSAIDKAVEELLSGDKKYTFFDMPQFKLLDPDFGKGVKEFSLAELLLTPPAQKETA